MTDRTTSTTRWLSLLAYTALRVALFAAAWALIAWLTPMDGVFAAVMAILVSGVISIPLLSHQRDILSMGLAAFFRRMNERIDASARAEDEPAADDSGDRERAAQRDAVAEDE